MYFERKRVMCIWPFAASLPDMRFRFLSNTQKKKKTGDLRNGEICCVNFLL